MGGRLGLERISFFFEKKEREHIEHFGPWASLYWAATKRAQKPKPKAHRRFDLEKLELPLRPPPSPLPLPPSRRRRTRPPPTHRSVHSGGDPPPRQELLVRLRRSPPPLHRPWIGVGAGIRPDSLVRNPCSLASGVPPRTVDCSAGCSN